MAENQGQRKIASVSTSTILKIVAVFLGLYFLYLIRDILLLLIVAMVLASALTPLVETLYRKIKFPRGLTVVLVYIVFIGVVVLISRMLFPRLVEELSNLGFNLEGLRNQLAASDSGIVRFLNEFGVEQFFKTIGNSLTALSTNALRTTLNFFSSILSIITVLVISFYLVIEQDAMKDFIKTLAPSQYHERINSIVQRVQNRLGGWLIGQIALMFVIFIVTYIALKILGIPNALALALFAGLLEIVPYLGPILAAIPAIFVGVLQSPLTGLIVLLVYIGIQQFENYILVPRILGKSIGANPLIVLIALLIGFRLAGIVGMLIAAPIVAVMTVVLEDYYGHRKSQAETT